MVIKCARLKNRILQIKNQHNNKLCVLTILLFREWMQWSFSNDFVRNIEKYPFIEYD